MLRLPRDLESSGSEYRAPSSTDSDDSGSTKEHTIVDEQSGREYVPFNPDLVFKNPQGDSFRPFRANSEDRFEKHTKGAVGFRTWDSDNAGTNTRHGFWAGDFHTPYRAPISRNDPEFILTAMYHLWRDPKRLSQLVSIWLTPLPAIHRLMRSKTATVSFLNVDYLRKEDERYPTVYSAGSLIKHYRMRLIGFPDGTPFKYKGAMEYLVWQHIDEYAIFCSISRDEFDLFCKGNPDLKTALSLDILSEHDSVERAAPKVHQRALCTRRVGYVIGRLLQRIKIPRRFVKKLAWTFATNFQFYGHEKRISKEQYLQGAWKGYYSNLKQCGLAATPLSLRKEPLLANETDLYMSPCIRAERVKEKIRKTASKAVAIPTRMEYARQTRSSNKPGFGNDRTDHTTRKPVFEQKYALKSPPLATELVNNFSPSTKLQTPPETSPLTKTLLAAHDTVIILDDTDDTEDLYEASVIKVGSPQNMLACDTKMDENNVVEDQDSGSNSMTLVGEPADSPYHNDAQETQEDPINRLRALARTKGWWAPGCSNNISSANSAASMHSVENEIIYMGSKRRLVEEQGEPNHLDDFIRTRRWIEAYLDCLPHRPIKRMRESRAA